MVKTTIKKIVVTLLFFILLFLSFITNNIKIKNFAFASSEKVTIINASFDFTANSNIENLADDEVYLGGIPIGIKVGSDGVIVTGFNDIITNIGKINIKGQSNIKVGDIITNINGIRINSIDDINAIVNKSSEIVNVCYKRNNEENTTKLKIYNDIKLNKNQLGIKVKDKVLGIGTLTFVDKNKNFASLGHHILNSDSGASTILNNGNIYNSFIANSTKSSYNLPGHLNGMIIENREIGTISKNNCFGLYGKGNSNIVTNLQKIKLGSKDDIVLGKAQVLSTIRGTKPKLYDIEIIKTIPQNQPTERGMVVRVVDKELIASTGGIVQGMSGSPIIQNGKLIGALTHVFLNDSKKGYGLYIDWMLNN